MPNRRFFLRSSGAILATTWVGQARLATAAVEDFIGKSGQLPSVEKIRSGPDDYWKLFDLINEYRRGLGLRAIPLSPKLTAVAALHARDLHAHRPHEKNISLHSWSKSERWRGGTYLRNDKESWPIMWDKPKELFDYGSYGFEVTVADARDAEHALEVLKKSDAHNNVLVNRGPWRDKRWQWQALGAVFYDGFACAWFGNVADR